MAAPNVFQELKNVLTELKTFLDGPTVAAIKTAIHTLAAIVPQINDVVTELIKLLTKLDTAIQNLNVAAVGGDALAKVATFSASMKTLLETAKGVLPAESAKIDEVITGIDFVSGLPSVDALKGEIHTLLGDLINTLNGFKG
jgi:ABC-type transporter Mla subunit MlaD